MENMATDGDMDGNTDGNMKRILMENTQMMMEI